jgi:hypothetical protein
LLVAVADGEERSVALASELARAVLNDPVVRRALALEELLRTRSPFALVRAVELAEQVMSNGQPMPAPHAEVDRRKP